ncbi:glutamine amidotransferase [Sphingomonas sp. PAMC 26605]|uniref:glutamine amidotransferase n=1 Tax=Sphingomonas sp. PAMC 26605 TaxID=1112214 RepID=UPI00026CB1D0|nr:glutamine amidotransferase [Sphingomonas sp. PAMC 26605]
MRTVAALRHVAFEGVGSFTPILAAHGLALRYVDAGVDPLSHDDPSLLIVLGGPIGVYEAEAYPFLRDEIALLRRRIAVGAPTLGICLGAQLIATALGADVSTTGRKEIGFSPIELTKAGASGPLRHLANVPVLHWHGDRFAIPPGADHLAATPICDNQAFAMGTNLLGLQFHPEIVSAEIERWLIGHACELAGAGIDPVKIRADAARYGPALESAAQAMLGEWLTSLS